MTASSRIESMMNPKLSKIAARDDGIHEFPGSDKGRPRDDRFTERIRAFEQCCTSDPACVNMFLRIAAADLLRTMPLIERAVVEELTGAFKNPFEHMRPALRRYVQTLQVLRRALQMSVALETQAQPSATNVQTPHNEGGQS